MCQNIDVQFYITFHQSKPRYTSFKVWSNIHAFDLILWCYRCCCDWKMTQISYVPLIVPYWIQGLYSLSGKTSYRQISWSLEAARLDVAIVVLLWNLTGTSAAALPNFRAIVKVQTRISRLRDFTRSCGKTSYRLLNRGPGRGVWSRVESRNVFLFSHDSHDYSGTNGDM